VKDSPANEVTRLAEVRDGFNEKHSTWVLFQMFHKRASSTLATKIFVVIFFPLRTEPELGVIWNIWNKGVLGS
jgi:hypothetical protein